VARRLIRDLCGVVRPRSRGARVPSSMECTVAAPGLGIGRCSFRDLAPRAPPSSLRAPRVNDSKNARVSDPLTPSPPPPLTTIVNVGRPIVRGGGSHGSWNKRRTRATLDASAFGENEEFLSDGRQKVDGRSGPLCVRVCARRVKARRHGESERGGGAAAKGRGRPR
jgi:hypothetical protein